jgi:hypothetical protein
MYDIHVSKNTPVSSIFDSSTFDRVNVETTASMMGRGVYLLNSINKVCTDDVCDIDPPPPFAEGEKEGGRERKSCLVN